MYRDKIMELKEWKDSKNRKPLILNGARQVGKTWLLKEFGKECYESVVYINTDDNPQIEELFSLDFDTKRIIQGLELYSGMKIEPGKTLIILDEVQQCPRVLHALKYFYEDSPEYHIAVAGSLLGITLSEGSFPVGKVNTKDLCPMTFSEFLRAIGREQYAQAVSDGNISLLGPFHDTMIDFLKNYLVVGGMPEAVQNYIDEGNLLKVREIQQEILADYERDFAKHAPRNLVPKILEITQVLPRELAKENKKFLFSMIRTGARAAEYEDALLWLEDAGIARRVRRVSAIKFPLSAYVENDAFKLYFVDVGLLGALARLDPKIVLDGDALFTEFRGAMSEQLVFSELTAAGEHPYYYKKDKPTREVDFIIEKENEVVAIEVKSGEKTYSKSLGEAIRKYDIKTAYKLSQAKYRPRDKGAVEYRPLYSLPL